MSTDAATPVPVPAPRTDAAGPPGPDRAAPPDPRRWWVLAVLGLAQLMVVLDATIVNIALPRAQVALGFSDDGRQWIVTSYALAFGALLLIGGRLGDVFGRKTTLMVGLSGFAVASAAGGAATSFGVLVAARAGQGVFAALLAPAALALLSTTFTDASERARAYAIFGAIAGGGGALGLILGGALTEWLSWRWCLYVNLAIAVPVLLAGTRLLRNDRPEHPRPIDVPGTVAVTAALFSIVYGFSSAESNGWGATTTVTFLALGVVLLAAFVALQLRVAHPILPMRILLDRDRGSSYVSMMLAGAGIFAVFLFLTYYIQVTLGYSPLRTGIAFLPMIGGLAVMAQLAGLVLPKVGPRPLVPAGMLLAAAGMLVFTRLEVDASYATDLLPGLLLTGFGLGLIFAPSFQAATSGVAVEDAGAASATVNTVQQVGGSIGTAVFSTLAASATSDYLLDHPAGQVQAALEGYLTVFGWTSVVFLIGAVLAAVLLRSGPLPDAAGEAAPMVH